MLKTNIVFIDFETTGINVFNSDPIEIGAVLVNRSLEIEDSFSSFIRPNLKSRQRVSSFKTHGNQIEELADAPQQGEVLKRYFGTMGTDYCFAGWNISFDVPYFKKMCFRNHMMREFNKINYRHIDIQSIVRYLSEKNMINANLDSLDDCLDYYGFSRRSKHSAIEDAKLTFKLFKNFINYNI